jgi:hypothetical protein
MLPLRLYARRHTRIVSKSSHARCLLFGARRRAAAGSACCSRQTDPQTTDIAASRAHLPLSSRRVAARAHGIRAIEERS